jgi:hypothetical protein
LRSFATENIISRVGFQGGANKSSPFINKIQVVLHDAEKRQVSDESVRIWLPKLRDVAYDVVDMLDEATHFLLQLSIPNESGKHLI